MDRFVAEQNIEHFRRLLETERNEQEKQSLRRLLADHEAKLHAIEKEERERRAFSGRG
jgi:hypothetical protein